MATPALRPLGVGEILDVGIKLYLRHWRTLMLCVLGVVLPLQVVSVLVTASVAPEALEVDPDPSGLESGETDALLAARGIVAVLSVIMALIAIAACFKAVSDAYLGSRPDAGRSLRFAVRRLPRLLWLGIVLGLALVLAFVAVIVPGVWLSVAWALSVPALLFERVGALQAMGRSFRLVQGRWWATAGTLVVGLLLMTVVAGIVEGVLLYVPAAASDDSQVVDAVATVIAGTVSSVITTPYTAAVVTLLYFDARVRKEGFDLQLLAGGLGAERDLEAPPPDWSPPPRSPGGWLPPQAPGGPET